MPNPNTKGISVHVDRELHAEITAYLQEHNMKMADFISLAAQDVLRPQAPEMDHDLLAEIAAYLEEHHLTRDEFLAQAAYNELHPQIPGIDAELRAEINAYLEENDMTMDEFIALAAQDELHPKTQEVEVKDVENMRTLAFQVPESLFQRVKQYLERNNMTQKAFVIGLIEDELDRDEELLRKQAEQEQPVEKEEQDEGLSEGSEAPVTDESPEDEYGDVPEEGPAVSDFEGEQESQEGQQDVGLSEGSEAPVTDESPEDEYEDEPEEGPAVGDSEGEQESREEQQDEGLSEGSEAPVTGESPEDEYGAEPEEGPAVSNSEGGFEPEDEEETGADYEEVEDGAFPEETGQDKPSPGYIEGELGAAVEVAPNFYYDQDEQPSFPEPEDEEDQEFGSMSM